MPFVDMTTPRTLTVSTGLVSGGQNQRDYSYVGTMPGVTSNALPVFGSAPYQRTVSYNTGVTAPWARQRVKFRV